MKALILAAGYATRLYPLTKNKPKPLLPIGNKPMIDYIIDEIVTVPEIDQITVVTNSRFYEHFLDWRSTEARPVKVNILDDGTNSDDDKRGAIGDILFSIKQEQIEDDLLVIAGDNFFTYKLADYIQYFRDVNRDCVCVKEMADKEALKQLGICELDEKGKVIGFEEKPQRPKSNMAVYAAYLYQRETLPLFERYMLEGNKPDAPGFFIEWLYKEKDLYAYKMKGDCYDIGTPRAYEEVQVLFGGK